jgi:hypothetical protein
MPNSEEVRDSAQSQPCGVGPSDLAAVLDAVGSVAGPISTSAESFRLGESWPDWWGRMVSHNIAITGNFDKRHLGGPDFAIIRRHSGGVTVKTFGELISPEDFQ